MRHRHHPSRLAVIFFTCAATGFCTSARSQEREWSLDRTDQDAFLVFGTPNTDDVGVSFWCGLGSKRLRFYLPLRAKPDDSDHQSELQFMIESETFKAAGKITTDQASEISTLEADFKIDDSLVLKLQSAGYFAVTADGQKRTIPLDGADFSGLIRLCAKPLEAQQ
jgi:hypothetical protein